MSEFTIQDDMREAIEELIASYLAAHGISGGGTPANGSIVTAMLANGAVTADKIAAQTITADEIAGGVITSYEIEPGGIEGDQSLADESVTADKLAEADSPWGGPAVTTPKIADGAITLAKLAQEVLDAINGSP